MRLFIATTFPADVLRLLSERVAPVRPKLPPASWVRPETQHLTFAFLGEQPEPLVDALAPLLTTRLRSVPRFDACLRGCGFFPNPRHARVGWVGAEPEERFGEVANAVRSAVKDAGVELDRSEFRPHLTMMRMREGWPPLSIETFTKALRDYKSETFPVDGVTLYASKLSPKGAEHTALREFELRA
jgi:RNA 2',3'-cyclic 3'-phosphodiesterase